MSARRSAALVSMWHQPEILEYVLNWEEIVQLWGHTGEAQTLPEAETPCVRTIRNLNFCPGNDLAV